ncbi:MAG TPA: transcriptional regulator [Candidatus Dormibacteraeota bacterium]|jgi:predicted DNA-binding transcriptional regulator YafY
MPSTYEPGEKFIRVFQLYQRLCETRTGLTTAQLAEELEVTVRSVQRYLATLRDSAGIDIEEESGRFRVGDRTRLPAMQLDQHQAAALLLAVRLLHQMRPNQDPALVGALAQLATALRLPLVVRYLESTIVAIEARPPNPTRQQVERTVVEAFVQSRVAEIEYEDAEGKATRRAIHPYFLEPRPEGRTIYVLAYDEKSKEVRSFRLDRIASARLLAHRFEVPEDFDVDAHLAGSWGIWRGDGEEEVVLRFEPRAARRVKQTVWHPSARLTELDGGGVEMRLTVSSEVEMRPWVLGWGDLVEVLEPPSLRAHVSEAVHRAAERYRGDR